MKVVPAWVPWIGFAIGLFGGIAIGIWWGLLIAIVSYGARPLHDGRTVHLGTAESGNTWTVCGRKIDGWWRLVDGRVVECSACIEGRPQGRPRPDFDPRIDYPERYSNGGPI